MIDLVVSLDQLGRIVGSLDQLGQLVGSLDQLGQLVGSLDQLGRIIGSLQPVGRIVASLEPVGQLVGPLEPLARWLFAASWKASMVVLLVLAVQKLLRDRLSPRWSHALWGLVILRLLMPALPESSASLFNLGRLAPSVARLATDFSRVAPDLLRRAAGLSWLTPGDTRPARAQAEPPGTALFPEAPPTGSGRLELTLQESSPAPGTPVMPVLIAIWALGISFLGAQLLRSTRRMQRRLRDATPVNVPWMLELLEVCRTALEVRQKVGMVTTSIVDTPALTGLLRPRLLLPQSLLADVSPLQLRFIFLHELAHLKRHDLFLNWLTLALQILHWPNLFIRYAFHRMRADRELACDDLVLSRLEPAETRDYGRTIIALLERLSHPAPMPGAVGILEHRQQIERRIVMIARFRGKSSRLTWPAAALLAGLGVTALTEAAPAPVNTATSSAVATVVAGASGTPLMASAGGTPATSGSDAAKSQPLSAAQEKVARKLGVPISLALESTSYRKALDAVIGASKVKVDFAPETKAGIDAEGKVGLKATKVSAAMALKSLLTARGLVYVLTDDGVRIEKPPAGSSSADSLARLSGDKGGKLVVVIKDGEGIVRDDIMGLDEKNLADGTEDVSVDADGRKVVKRVVIKKDGKEAPGETETVDENGVHRVKKVIVIKGDGIPYDPKVLEGPDGQAAIVHKDAGADGKKVVREEKIIVNGDAAGHESDGQEVEKRVRVIKLDGEVSEVKLEGLDKDTERLVRTEIDNIRGEGDVDMKTAPADGELKLVIEGPGGQKAPDGKPVKQEKKVIIMKQKKE